MATSLWCSTMKGPASKSVSTPSYYKGPWSDFALIQVDPVQAECLSSTIAWYNDDYDNGYQGIVGVTEVPGFPE